MSEDKLEDYIKMADGTLRDSAYYYSFELTGCPPIDRILAAIAAAGKAFHHTDNWMEPVEYFPGKICYVDLIQHFADAAAIEWNKRAKEEK